MEKLPTDDLMTWADLAASGMQRYLDDFRRTKDEAFVGEVTLAAVSMEIVVDVLSERLARERHKA